MPRPPLPPAATLGAVLALVVGCSSAAPVTTPPAAPAEVAEVAEPAAQPVPAADPAVPSDAPRGPFPVEPVLSGVGTDAPRPLGESAPREPALVAAADGSPVRTHTTPDDGAAAVTFPPTTPLGSPRVFLVVDEQEEWLRVLLPGRPLGASGWVRRDAVSLRSVEHRVRVELGAHRLSLLEGDTVLLQGPVAVGRPAAPTPVGRFFVTDLLRAPDPGGSFGAYAFGLSGRSEVLTEFAGGDGQLAVHGTNRPDLLGTDASSGCIRVGDEVLDRLVGLLPLGTPVDVVA